MILSWVDTWLCLVPISNICEFWLDASKFWYWMIPVNINQQQQPTTMRICNAEPCWTMLNPSMLRSFSRMEPADPKTSTKTPILSTASLFLHDTFHCSSQNLKPKNHQLLRKFNIGSSFEPKTTQKVGPMLQRSLASCGLDPVLAAMEGAKLRDEGSTSKVMTCRIF